MKPKSGKARRALFILFIIYCAAMLLLLFARSSRYVGGSYIEQLKMNLNLVPLDTMRRFVYVIKHNPNPHMLRCASESRRQRSRVHPIRLFPAMSF